MSDRVMRDTERVKGSADGGSRTLQHLSGRRDDKAKGPR